MFSDLLNLFYPRLCSCCSKQLDKNENVVCTSCLHQLPVTENYMEEENTTSKIFYGRVKIENASSLLLFEKKGLVQSLIHELKYKGQEEIGKFLGSWMGELLSSRDEYKGITAIVPVPLHKNKLRKRGYNQVEKFGQELALCLNAHYVDDVLVKITKSNSQTRKRRLSRWGKIEESFKINKKTKLKDAHILLVDDLVTTGATLEACIKKLQEIEGIKISIATMAIAD